MKPHKRFYTFTLLFAAFFIAFLVACGGEAMPAASTNTVEVANVEPTETETAVPTETSTPEPTETPRPTATPTETPTPEPTEDPYPDYTVFTDETLNLALRFPETWFIYQQDTGGLISIAANEAAMRMGYSEGALILVIPDQLPIAPEAYVEVLMASITGNENLVIEAEQDGDIETININSYPAARVAYTAVLASTKEDVQILLVTIESSNGLISFFTLLPLSMLEEAQPVYENIVNSVDLGEASAVTTFDESMFYVADYNPERDPGEDVAAALEIAANAEKRVLLIVGGDWCITCHILDGFIKETPAVAAGLQENYVLVKVNFSEENENETFLSGYPEIEWFPHFYILNADGSLAESYDTRGLETDGLYDEAKFLAFLAERSGESSSIDTYYVVASYDPARDPQADVAAAVQLAQEGNKRILLIAGGEWCIWCHILEDYIHKTPAVEEILIDSYLIVKVNFSEENTNNSFFDQYPTIAAYPHIFVLDSNGEFLHSQSTGVLESGNSYDETKMLEFLSAWAPPS